MYYDRFDIVEAHYWWNVDHHGGQASPEYERQCHISEYFTPSIFSNGPSVGNAQEIYDALCTRGGKCIHE